MRHQKRSTSLGRKAEPRKALLRTLSHSLVMHGFIITTITKAKVLRPQIEKLITVGKEQTLSARKKLSEKLPEQSAKKIYSELAKTYEKRNGGYTRITKLDNRVGDNAQKAKIEFV